MKICSILFSLLDTDNTNQLEEYQIRALLMYLTNMNKTHMSTIIYKLGIELKSMKNFSHILKYRS